MIKYPNISSNDLSSSYEEDNKTGANQKLLPAGGPKPPAPMGKPPKQPTPQMTKRLAPTDISPPIPNSGPPSAPKNVVRPVPPQPPADPTISASASSGNITTFRHAPQNNNPTTSLKPSSSRPPSFDALSSSSYNNVASAPTIADFNVNNKSSSQQPPPIFFPSSATVGDHDRRLLFPKIAAAAEKEHQQPNLHHHPHSFILSQQHHDMTNVGQQHNPSGRGDTALHHFAPLPPPYNLVQHMYDALEMGRGHKWVFYFALFELILSLACVALAITSVSISDLRRFFPLFEPLWTTPFYFVNALLGIIAAKKASDNNRRNFFVAHLIGSVLCVVFSVVLVALGSLELSASGRTTGTEVDCVIFRHDHEKFKRLNANVGGGIKFDRCVWAFKLAISVWTSLFILAIFMGFANLGSVVLCILRTGNCERLRRNSTARV